MLTVRIEFPLLPGNLKLFRRNVVGCHFRASVDGQDFGIVTVHKAGERVRVLAQGFEG